MKNKLKLPWHIGDSGLVYDCDGNIIAGCDGGDDAIAHHIVASANGPEEHINKHYIQPLKDEIDTLTAENKSLVEANDRLHIEFNYNVNQNKALIDKLQDKNGVLKAERDLAINRIGESAKENARLVEALETAQGYVENVFQGTPEFDSQYKLIASDIKKIAAALAEKGGG